MIAINLLLFIIILIFNFKNSSSISSFSRYESKTDLHKLFCAKCCIKNQTGKLIFKKLDSQMRNVLILMAAIYDRQCQDDHNIFSITDNYKIPPITNCK